MIHKKNDYPLLCSYYDLLHGATDNKLRENLSQSDINILHKFHKNAAAGMHFCNLSAYPYNKSLRRAMFQMFETWQRGQPIPEPESFFARRGLALAFSARLNGATDDEIKESGFTDDDIEKVDKFLMYADSDMTIRDRINKTGVGEYSARAMMKIYQEQHPREAGVLLETESSPVTSHIASEINTFYPCVRLTCTAFLQSSCQP